MKASWIIVTYLPQKKHQTEMVFGPFESWKEAEKFLETRGFESEKQNAAIIQCVIWHHKTCAHQAHIQMVRDQYDDIFESILRQTKL